MFLSASSRHLHYPNDIDKSLNEASVDKIRKYRTYCNSNPPNSISFMPVIDSTFGRLHSDFVLLFLQAHRETDHFFGVSDVQLAHSTSSTTSVWCSPPSLDRRSAD
jgi:hypothetical protein